MKFGRLINLHITILCLVSTGLLLFSCSGSKSFRSWDPDITLLGKIDSLCQAQMDTGHFPGLAVAIAYGQGKVWCKGYGYANLKNRVPVDADDHLFRIGSISKSVTAAALARLEERGEINLDTTISAYYQACPADKSMITLRQLGGHLAGIRHYRGVEFFSNIPYKNVFDPLEVFIHDTLLCKPGDEFNYSSYGWTLISAVMENAKQVPFTSILKHEVNQPLNLTDLKPDQKDSTSYKRVTFYEFQDGAHIPSVEVDNSNKWAGGGLLCSAQDIARFGFALTSPGYLKQKTIDEFSSSQSTSYGRLTNYGIGFNNKRDESGRRWIGHSGGSTGGTSMMLIYPKQDVVVVTLVNMGNAQMDDLAWKIADLFIAQKK